MAVSSMSRPSLAPFHRADEESDSSYSSDSDYFLPDDGAVLGVGDDAWLPPPRSLPEQATLREPFEEQLDEEELIEGELGEGELDEGEREGLHLGIGDGSGDTDFEKALFNALVPIDTTLSPATAGARRTRERAAAPQTELSAECHKQSSLLNGSYKQLHLQEDPRTIHTPGLRKSSHCSYSAVGSPYMLRPSCWEDSSSICSTVR